MAGKHEAIARTLGIGHSWNPRNDRAFADAVGNELSIVPPAVKYSDVINNGKTTGGTENGTAGAGALADTQGTGRFVSRDSMRFFINGSTDNRYITYNIAGRSWPNPVWLSIYIPHGRKYADTGAGILLYVSDDDDLGTGGDGRWFWSSGNSTFSPGWNLIPIYHSDYSDVDGGSTAIGELTIQSYRLRINGQAAGVLDFYVDALLGSVESEPQVVFTFDDGNDDTLTAANVANAKGVPITAFIIPDIIGNANKLTAANVTTLVSNGNEIGCHDDTAWPGVGTQSAIAAQIKSMKDQTEALSGRPVLSCSYPGGDFGQENIGSASTIQKTTSAVLDAGLAFARGTNTAGKALGVPFGCNTLTVPAQELDDNLSLAAAKALVDQAISEKTTIVFYGHLLAASATADTWASDDWSDLIDYVATKVAAGSIKARTFSGAMQAIALKDPVAAAQSIGSNTIDAADGVYEAA